MEKTQSSARVLARPIWVALVALILATLACNFTESTDEGETSNTGTKPTIAILTPTTNTIFSVNQEIVVQVRASDLDGAGITRIALFVGNAPESVDSFTPTPRQKEITASLRWTPTSASAYTTLVVRAYRDNISSDPVLLQISVQGSNISLTATLSVTASSGTVFVPPQNVTPQPTFDTNPACRANVNVTELNYRSSPDTSGSENIIGRFQYGEQPLITGRLADNLWYQVQNTGWIFAEYTTRLGNCRDNVNLIPIVSIQVATTPTVFVIPSATPTQSVAVEPADLQVRIIGLAEVTLSDTGTATENYIFQIQNIGGTASGPFQAQIVLPGGQVVLQDVPSLAAGASINLPSDVGQSITFSAVGDNVISLSADYQNVVVEKNEGNNIISQSVKVSAPQP